MNKELFASTLSLVMLRDIVEEIEKEPLDVYFGDLNHDCLVDIETIGEGIGGLVYKSKHVETNIVYARKVLKLGRSDPSEYIKEVETLRKCYSPNIITCYGAFVYDNDVSICLEYMDMGSFSDILVKIGPLDESILAHLAKSVKIFN